MTEELPSIRADGHAMPVSIDTPSHPARSRFTYYQPSERSYAPYTESTVQFSHPHANALAAPHPVSAGILPKHHSDNFLYRPSSAAYAESSGNAAQPIGFTAPYSTYSLPKIADTYASGHSTTLQRTYIEQQRHPSFNHQAYYHPQA